MARFAASIEALSDGAIKCRGLGHAWIPYLADSVEQKGFHGYNVTLVCGNGCGTMKHFMLSQRGEYYPATYSYGDEYLLAKGNPYITKEDKGQFKLQALSEILPHLESATVTHITSKRRRSKGKSA
jgi:hypothetical protein